MREYSVDVNETQAKRVALDIARDDVSIPWLVKLIDTAFDNVIRQEDAFAAVSRMFQRHGYTLSHTPTAERPTKACKSILEDGEQDSDPDVILRGMRNLGERIRFLRKEKNWSQGELATKIGCKQGIISLFERNCQTPSEEVLSKLADALDTTTFILTGVGDKTPMTERMYLGRKHPVVDHRPKKSTGPVRRFQEEGEDDDLPSGRKIGSKWDPVTETGPQVRAIIQANNISVTTLRDSFEVTFEEYGRIRTQDWADFGARWMHELLTDLRREYKEVKVAKPVYAQKPEAMTRSQLVSELGSAMEFNKWLTKEELVQNFEFGENEVEWIQTRNHTKFNVTELRMHVHNIRAAIAERAIEVSGE